MSAEFKFGVHERPASVATSPRYSMRPPAGSSVAAADRTGCAACLKSSTDDQRDDRLAEQILTSAHSGCPGSSREPQVVLSGSSTFTWMMARYLLCTANVSQYRKYGHASHFHDGSS